MQVVQVTQFGGPEVLELAERAAPVAGEGEVEVEVTAAEVLFLDTQLRAGWGREFFPLQPPFVLGAGVAGTVAGRPVVAAVGDVGTYPGGGYAESVVVPKRNVHDVAPGIEPAVALAALHDGPTALELVTSAAPRPRERVLVNGASGSLGHWLIPLAKEAGVEVVAAARGAAKLEKASRLGADAVVDYSEPGWAARVGPVDVVFDAAGGEIGRAAFGILRRGGRFHAFGAASGEFAGVDDAQARERGVTVVGIHQPDPRTWVERPAEALAAIADGRVTPSVGATFALADAAAAHAAIEARRTTGKTVLLIDR
jgi:NADPH2:quinone reductase